MWKSTAIAIPAPSRYKMKMAQFRPFCIFRHFAFEWRLKLLKNFQRVFFQTEKNLFINKKNWEQKQFVSVISLPKWALRFGIMAFSETLWFVLYFQTQVTTHNTNTNSELFLKIEKWIFKEDSNQPIQTCLWIILNAFDTLFSLDFGGQWVQTPLDKTSANFNSAINCNRN